MSTEGERRGQSKKAKVVGVVVGVVVVFWGLMLVGMFVQMGKEKRKRGMGVGI